MKKIRKKKKIVQFNWINIKSSLLKEKIMPKISAMFANYKFIIRSLLHTNADEEFIYNRIINLFPESLVRFAWINHERRMSNVQNFHRPLETLYLKLRVAHQVQIFFLSNRSCRSLGIHLSKDFFHTFFYKSFVVFWFEFIRSSVPIRRNFRLPYSFEIAVEKKKNIFIQWIDSFAALVAAVG